jgi:hypothetical protein
VKKKIKIRKKEYKLYKSIFGAKKKKQKRKYIFYRDFIKTQNQSLLEFSESKQK